MRATAGHAVYEGAGEWLHLTQSPRVEDGGLQLTADKVDVSQESGDAFAHGNVKATWVGSRVRPGRARQTSSASAGQRARAVWFWAAKDRRTYCGRGATASGDRRSDLPRPCAAVAAGELGCRRR